MRRTSGRVPIYVGDTEEYHGLAMSPDRRGSERRGGCRGMEEYEPNDDDARDGDDEPFKISFPVRITIEACRPHNHRGCLLRSERANARERVRQNNLCS